MIDGVVLRRLDGVVDPGGPVYAVVDGGRHIGELVAVEWRSIDWTKRTPSRTRWRVRSAGAGVTVPALGTLDTQDDAVTLIRVCRRDSRALDVDPTTGLTGLERDVLDFVRCFPVWRKHWRQVDAIDVLFGLREARFWQVVAGAIRKPGAVRYAPETVNRLRRLEESREQRHLARDLKAFGRPHHPLFAAGRVRIGPPGDNETYEGEDTRG